MKKKRLLIVSGSLFLILILAMLSIMTACEQAATSEKIVLKYGSYSPRVSMDEPVIWWVQEAAKRSGIDVELEFYWAEALAKAPDCLNALKAGIYDIGWITPVFTPAQLPSWVVLNGPVYTRSIYAWCKASAEFSNQNEKQVADWNANNVKYLLTVGGSNYQLLSKKPVQTLEDVKGLKGRTFGYHSIYWQELGGAPITMSMPEIYTGLQTGAIDAVLQQPATFYTARYFEVAKNFTYAFFGNGGVPVVMNLDKWNSLPQKLQKAMMDLAVDMPEHVYTITTESELKAVESLKNEGVAVYTLSDADLARIWDAVAIGREKALADMEGKDLPARDVYDTIMPLIEKYEKEAQKKGFTDKI
jgi:TRAP-type C4-dicarboxylate transport system substrate-binding protein